MVDGGFSGAHQCLHRILSSLESARRVGEQPFRDGCFCLGRACESHRTTLVLRGSDDRAICPRRRQRCHGGGEGRQRVLERLRLAVLTQPVPRSLRLSGGLTEGGQGEGALEA